MGWLMSSFESRVGEIVAKAANRLSPTTYISSAVRDMERWEVDELAAAYLLAAVRNRQRSGVARTERDAQVAYRPSAVKPELEAAAARDDEEARLRLNREMKAIIDAGMDRYATKLRMQWTDELLRSEFALGDGSKVTWGEATKGQHELRMQMHLKNAAAGVEAAARHREAIAVLDSSRATTLNEAVMAPA